MTCVQCCRGVRRLRSYLFRADGGLRRRKDWEGWKESGEDGGGEDTVGGRMKWKRSRRGEKFEGCEEFKRGKGGETDKETTRQ